MASGLNVKLPLLLFLAGLFLWTVVFLTGVMAAPANTSEVDVIGRRLYEVNCAVCHDKGLAEAPLTDALRKLTIDHISRSLNDGVMLVQSGHLTLAQRNAIAD